jgi:hypothetical protein
MRLPLRFLVAAAIAVSFTGLLLGMRSLPSRAATLTRPAAVQQAPAREPVQRALLIGINTYQPSGAGQSATEPVTTIEEKSVSSVARRGKGRSGWSNLDGPINDIEAMREILISRYGFKPEHIRALKDTEATREGMLAAIRQHLIDEAAAGDVALFFYAGHGSQVLNSKSTEVDKLDESLVPADSARGALDIRDKELARLFNQSLDKGVMLTVILDSCHSGSIARGYPREEKVRMLPYDPRDAADPPDRGKRPEERGALIFSAAQDTQLAAEEKDDQGTSHGVFSAALLKILRSAPVNESADAIYKRVKALMQSGGRMQEPVLASNEERKRRSLFGTEAGSLSGRTTVAVLRVEGNGIVQLQGGRAVGLIENCELKKAGKSVQSSVRLQVISVEGLNRCRAKVIAGNVRSVQPGDLFEVDRWVAPNEAILRVWMPPATLAAADVLRAAQEFSTLRTAAQIQWIDDPTEVTATEAPTQVLFWEGTEWQLLRPGGQIEKLGKSPTARMVLDKLAASDAAKARLFVHLPPPAELARELKLGDGTPHDAIKVVASRQEANYLLLGRAAEKELQLAWGLPNVAGEQGRHLPLPARSDWITIGQSPEALRRAAWQLTDKALRIGKVKAWLQLEAPPDNGLFPYRLALKNTTTGEYRSEGTTVFDGESYGLVLRADKKALAEARARGIEPRFIYVFTIDSNGQGQLLYPAATAGSVENRLPRAAAGAGQSEIPTEILLGRSDAFSISEPFGIDTYLLVTSAEAITNLEAFEFDGARTSTPRGEASALERLLFDVGSSQRGQQRKTPVDWSIQRISIRSAPRK